MNKKSELLSEILIIGFSLFISYVIVNIYFFSYFKIMTNDCVDDIAMTSCKKFNDTFYRYARNGDIAKGIRIKELLNHAKSNQVNVINNVSGDIINDNYYRVSYEYAKYGWIYEKNK